MEKEILNVNEALVYLKERIVLKNNNSLFKYKNKRIYIYSTNSSYSLSYKEFLELYKENNFIVYDENEVNIDFKRDEEYYSFKHK